MKIGLKKAYEAAAREKTWGRLTAVINLRSGGDHDYVESYS